MARYEVKLKNSKSYIYIIDCDTCQKRALDIDFYKYDNAGRKELVASFDRHSVERVVKVGD